MEFRRLGNSGLVVSVVGLGTNNLGMKLDLDRSRAVVHAALDEGITLFDTADSYGASEERLGEILQGSATTSCSRPSSAATARAAATTTARTGVPAGRGATSDGPSNRRCAGCAPTGSTCTSCTVRTRRRRSRRRCRRSTTWCTRARCATSAAPTSPAGRSPRRTGPPAPAGSSASSVAQNEYSWLERGIEADLVPALEHYGIGLLPFFPLANGLLTGKYRRGEAAPAAAGSPRGTGVGAHRRAFDVDREARRHSPPSATSRCSTSRSAGSPPSPRWRASSPVPHHPSRSAATSRPATGPWRPTRSPRSATWRLRTRTSRRDTALRRGQSASTGGRPNIVGRVLHVLADVRARAVGRVDPAEQRRLDLGVDEVHQRLPVVEAVVSHLVVQRRRSCRRTARSAPSPA